MTTNNMINIPTPFPLSKGGTGAALTASLGGIVYSTATTMAILAGTATANQVLLSGASAAPAWSTATYLATTTINQLLYSSSNNVIAGLATAINGVLVTSNSGVPSILVGPGATGRVLSSNAAAAPVWSTSTFPTVAGPLGSILISDGTNYIASTSLWPNTVGSAGKILRSDGTVNAYSTSTFADTYSVSTLLYASSANAVSGLATANSAGLVTNGSGVPAWQTLSSGQILIGSTGAAPVAAAIGSGTGILVGNGAGSITVSLAAIADHTLLANISGGAAAPTSTTLTALIDNAIGSTQGDILYRNATVWTVLAPGTAGQVLQTGGAAANPSWSTSTFPSTGGPAGNILISNGTNYIASTSLWPNTVGSAGTILRSNGTSNAYSTSTFADTYAVSNLLYASSSNIVTGLATANSGVLITDTGGVPQWKTGTFSILGIGGGAPDWFTPSVNGSIAQGFTALSPAFTPYSMPSSTLTANGILYASTTTAITQLAVGTSGQLLQSGGAGSAPAWTTATYPGTAGSSGNFLQSNGTNWTSASPAALTKTDDTNVTLTLGGSPTVALMAATSLTLGWTGQLGLTRGGTAASLTASNGGIVYSTASALAILAGTATAGLALLSGASTTPAWSQSPPLTRLNIQTFTASGTYTPTSGMKYCTIECVGGGGGGGGAQHTTGQGAAGGGGGGGGYARKTVTAATVGASQTVTIGAGGTAGAAAAGNGGAGGATSVGTICVAGGGAGGAGDVPHAVGGAAAGGLGGVGTTGDFVAYGQTGSFGMTVTGALVISGLGGSSMFGGGPVQQAAGGGNGFTGSNGNLYGGGAGGGATTSATTDFAGGVGAAGIVIVTEYVSL